MHPTFAIEKAGGREKLAKLLGVQTITTYHWDRDGTLPPKHIRYLEALRPAWFREYAKLRERQQPPKASEPAVA